MTANMERIAIIAREAARLGMSYGEYVHKVYVHEVDAPPELRKSQSAKKKETKKIVCAMCGSSFEVPKQMHGAYRKYCGGECQDKARLAQGVRYRIRQKERNEG